MCRSQAEGGRRCPGNQGKGESYSGTPFQGYVEHLERAAKLAGRIAGGETITGIMEADQLARGRARIEQIAKEGW